jgi:probable F420-dependent oxidoreductase
MKFGVSLFPLRHGQLAEVARVADELGYDAVFLGEHVISPVLMETQYPYSPSTDEAPAYHSGLPFFDPYAALSYVAAQTRHIKLCLSLSIVPLHDPYHLARSVATIDLFSDQRFLFGVGVGWLKEEFDILGVGWADRGRRLDETLDLLEVLWNEPQPSFAGEFFSLPPSMMEPKPATLPHPPYIFGGTTKAAIRRTAARGDGWYGVGVDPSTTAGLVEQIQARRPPDRPPVEITVGLAPDADVDDDLVEQFAAAGVDRLVVRPWQKGRDAVANVERFAVRMGLPAVAAGAPAGSTTR